jgi:hypothetical protein
MVKVTLEQTQILDPMFREGSTVNNPRNHFLPRDPVKALADVKWTLYERLDTLRQCLGPDGAYDAVDRQMQNEMTFLADLLDTIEKS